MFANLEAEMVRKKIKRSDIADAINVKYQAVLMKMNGLTKFSLDEATIIKEKFFPEIPIEVLFEKRNKSA